MYMCTHVGMYVRVCVCVCVRARVCARVSECTGVRSNERDWVGIYLDASTPTVTERDMRKEEEENGQK
jgi:biotin synthase-related radical SAM superfamily protein